ncbi:hydroxyisourate hydrolase [Cupriavidus sp. WGtm5]|uniref:hydroxyisourate hydrolase n=1 Tax=Cupriavidus TaxID=106589 RepID=UPI000E10604C|nr:MULTISPECIES: hydroxyisourate hydrolase [Cupriavidus]MCO4889452.1 hydroxyisourate hydrolase [Cupriavidus sp. WGtm5]ULX51261.1 5-hydroxyisourate hydrolase [Cupriavidus taiwanensis]SPA42304.1 putative Transthyretin-like protein [Cupriavidus taiwanensis]
MDDHTFDPARRRFALQSMTLGGGALLAGASWGATPDAPAPNQTAAPVQQGGLSPRLTLHALDTYHGTPAAGMRVEMFRIDNGQRVPLQTVTLAANGRSEPPLLIGDSYRTGTYELILHADEYFAARKASLPQPSFLSKIPLRVRVTDAGQRIHLPVLFGPWSYNYYRGS